jgi:nitroimidazol reductase NimA-like FMN-containing flavoprotein (pyridoxamine 5'-phosphate oxidase superfamily)
VPGRSDPPGAGVGGVQPMTSTWSRAEELDEAEAMHLLESTRWGRCAWTGPEGPRILPVNYAVVDGNVFFRTGLYGSLAEAAAGGLVALEADELDDRLASGWSVVVVGRAEQVDDPAEVAALFRRMADPWAPGPRPVLVRIAPSQVTGRRFTQQ